MPVLQVKKRGAERTIETSEDSPPSEWGAKERMGTDREGRGTERDNGRWKKHAGRSTRRSEH